MGRSGAPDRAAPPETRPDHQPSGTRRTSAGSGLRLALRTLDHTRITIGAQAVGIAQGALDFALGYVQERKQFGRAISDNQGVQFMLADMAMQLEAARQMVHVAAAKSERDDPDLSFFGAAAKITQIYEGTNQIQRIVMARQLLK